MNQNMIATLVSVEADATNKLPDRIHLLRTGTFNTSKYGKLEITADDLKEFVNNFNAGYGRPGANGTGALPVNFGHDKGGKAAAWINQLEADSEGNLWGITDWTGSGKAAIEAKDYGYISSEFTPRCLGGLWAAAEDATKQVRNVFTGAALTNIPMFNGNHGIMASSEPNGSTDEKQVIYINASVEDKEHRMPTLDEVRVKDATSLTADEKQILADNKASLSADELKKFGLVEASETKTELKTVEASAVEGTEGLVAVEASEIKALKDRVIEAESKVEASEAAKSELQKTVEAHDKQLADFKRKEVEASVAQHVARGAIVADQSKTWTDRIMVDASMEDLLKTIPSNKVVEASALGEEDKGEGAVKAADLLMTKAKEVMASNTALNIGDALSQVRKDEPELAAKADRNE